jgi:hypothetical protein
MCGEDDSVEHLFLDCALTEDSRNHLKTAVGLNDLIQDRAALARDENWSHLAKFARMASIERECLESWRKDE